MNSAQYGAIVGQVKVAHTPPMVRDLLSFQYNFHFSLSVVRSHLKLLIINFVPRVGRQSASLMKIIETFSSFSLSTLAN